MKKAAKNYLSLFGLKRAFTLIELLVSLAIASVLIALLTQILYTSLNSASQFNRGINREQALFFAMTSMIDEIEAADEIYKMDKNYIQLYERVEGAEGHKIVSYLLKDETLSRYGTHYHLKYDKKTISKTPGVRTMILDGVDMFAIEEKGDAIVIRMKCGKKELTRTVALRGAYE